MEEIRKNNNGTIAGYIMEDMSGYKIKDKTYYTGKLRTERHSGKIDLIPFTISEDLVRENNLDLQTTQKVAFAGELHSSQKIIGHKLWIDHTFKVTGIKNAIDIKRNNSIFLAGHLCRKPIFEITLSGSRICRLLLAVARGENEQIDYIPLKLWNEFADLTKDLNLKVGSFVEVFGRMEKVNENMRLKVSCGNIKADKTQDLNEEAHDEQ